MTARFRLILPTAETLAIAAFLFLVLQGFRLYLEWKMAAPLPPWSPVLQVGNAYLRGGAMAFGIFRVASLHPLFRPGYRTWLERTPWTSRKPLPLGPVALVWEDLFVLSVLALLALTFPGSDPWRLVALFFVGYLAALMLSFWVTGEPAYGYLVAFGIGLIVRLYAHPPAMVVAGLAVYPAAFTGLRRALARFPWGHAVPDGISLQNVSGSLQKTPTRSGWPYDKLGPSVEPAVHVGPLNSLLIGMLVGWWLYAIEAALETVAGRIILIGALVEGTPILAAVRLAIYGIGYASPVNLWGRLLTGRWIIPGYDQIFVGPICTLVAPVSALVLYRLGVAADVFLPVSCGVVLFTALATPPSVRRWRLTGRHRIVPAITNSKEFIKVG